MRFFKKHILTLILLLILSSTVMAADGIPVINVGGNIDTNMVVEDQIRTLNTDFFIAIGLGHLTGYEAVYINGYNPSVGTTKEVIMPSSVAGAYPYLSTDTTLSIVSTDVDDDGDPADTGARTVYIEGVNLAGAVINDTVTMNGTTPVNTNIQFYRVNEMYVTTAGSSTANEGIIDLKNGADILARIGFGGGKGEGKAQTGVYHVPAGFRFVLCRLFGSTVGGNNAHIHTSIRESGAAFLTERHFTLKDAPFSASWSYGFIVGARGDIEIVAHAAGGTAEIDAGMCGFLEPLP